MCPRTVVHRRKCTLKRTLWPELPSILSQQLQQSQIPQPSISRILHEIASKGPVYPEIQRSSIPVLTPYLSEMLPEIKNANFYLADVSARIKLFSYREGSKWRSLSLWPIACCLWPCVSP